MIEDPARTGVAAAVAIVVSAGAKPARTWASVCCVAV